MEKRKQNISEITRRILMRKESLKFSSEILRFLLAKGVSKSIAEELCQEIFDSRLEREESYVDLLREVLSKRLKTSGGFSLLKQKQRIVALVGPTGVGKTTTILKLANYFNFDHCKKVGLISLDHEKGGAFEQLEKYASLWNIPLANRVEAIETFVDTELILIDTTGCNFYQADQISELKSELTSLDNIEIHLTLSIAAKDVDLYGAVHQFSSLPLKSLIFTKLDETLTTGVLVNVCSKVNIPISYITYGYPLPGKIQVADSKEIIHKILVENNQEEFHFLRQFSIIDN